MAYSKRWLVHLFAAFTGHGFNKDLAKDFALTQEDLWSHTEAVSFRWPKLLWAYSVSVLAQITAPVLLFCLVLLGANQITMPWVFITVGFVTAGGFLFAVLFASAETFDVWRKSRKSGA
jgi:hypothetical protein